MEQIAEKVLQSLKEIKLAILSQEKKAQKFPEYKVEVLKSIYSSSLNPEKYDVAKINEIDSCNYLEFYLLKYFSNETRKEISFIKSLLVLINHKFRQGIVYWDDLSSENHSKTFESIIDAFFEIETTDLNNPEKIEYLQFLINLYRHQENTFIQKKCDKIISFGLWTNLSKPFLKSLFLKYPRFLKIYKTNVLAKKFTELETSFIVKLVDLFWKVIEKANTNNEAIEDESDQSIDVLEKIIEFFTDLMSQSSTRRHFRYVLLDRKFVILCKLTRLFNSSRGIRLKKLIENLQSYQDYALDEIDGTTQSVSMTTLLHYDALSEFQNILFSNFKERFETSLIKSINNIDSRKSLTEILDYLSDEEIVFVAQRLNLSIPDEKNWNENIFREDLSHIDLVIEILLDFLIKKKRPLDIVKNSALYPTEALLWDENLIPEDHDGRKTLTLPKINLQFLSLEDYLIRNFQLFRLESSYEIKKDIEDIVPRVHPNFDENGIFKSFGGWARMGTEIKEFLIQDVQAPPIGEEYPAKVLAEIKYSVGLMNTEIKHEWEALKEHDVILLISFKKLNNNLEDGESETPKSFCQEYGIQFVRGAEVVSQLDEDRNDLKDPDGSGKIKPEGSVRILQVILDSVQYKQDLKIISEKESEVYGDFQLIIRRKSKENNFKAILTTIRDLMKSDNLIPNWLEEVLLGYGDLESESYGEFKSKLSKNIDFYDTFLNYDHYKQNFIENSNIEKGVSDELLPSGLQQTSNLKEFSDWEVNLNFKNKKTPLNLHLSRKKKNSIKFTERQVEAIYKSLNEGLTLIEGPPGTGKTDVAVQICSLLYHNFSNERTLILTHSNNALNDIFEKIAKLDIDERYLLRLGMGEKDLDSTKNYGKYGRVNFMLERRLILLKEIKKLSDSLGVHIYHEFTCETAEIFYKFHVQSRWNEYSTTYLKKTTKAAEIAEKFPFSNYIIKSAFIKKNNGENLTYSQLFDENNQENNIQRAELYWEIINNIFEEVGECRGFELIRNNKERGNYVISKLARVIAMTSTHAALKRKDLLESGFEFDNIIVEEAGQLLEIDSFIPLTLQSSKSNVQNKIKRIILIGDHNQLPPIIKNNSYQKYSNMEQSMFTRLIRLGIPYVCLNMQGRCRSSLLELFNWRYPSLESLPSVLSDKTFKVANAGFKNVFQFINVPDFDSKGETSPMPHFYQNLAEAEYVVATYMFMILKGYPANKITILTTYNGQKFLIRDIFRQKCSWNPIFKKPKITTVDKYQGQQNDYILLSLVRTNALGHFRDPRRFTVAFSRAKLGLYIFGRYELFSQCQDLSKAFQPFRNQSKKLEILEDETFPSNRLVDNEGKLKSKTIEDFQDMYKIVQVLLEKQM